MNNKEPYTCTIHQEFYMETQCGRKPQNYFLILFEEIHSSEAPTSVFSSYNWKEATTPDFQAPT
jgi:hypothetical protein